MASLVLWTKIFNNETLKAKQGFIKLYYSVGIFEYFKDRSGFYSTSTQCIPSYISVYLV